MLKKNLNQLLTHLKSQKLTKDRQLVAIAGAPASGKSTLAAALVDELNKQGKTSTLVPMDGFHLDNPILIERGRLHRKGSPDTFDTMGLISLIKRIKNGEAVYAPRFDRDIETAIGSAFEIPSDVQWIIVEGNYLLLKDEPWNQLAALFDLTVFLEVSEQELEKRLLQRWYSYDYSEQKAKDKIEINDLPNARYVIQHSQKAMLNLKEEE